MSALTASSETMMKLLHKIPDLGEEATKRTWKMVTHTKRFTQNQKDKLVNALKKNINIKRRKSMMKKSHSKRGGSSCGTKKHGKNMTMRRYMTIKRYRNIGGSSCGTKKHGKR